MRSLKTLLLLTICSFSLTAVAAPTTFSINGKYPGLYNLKGHSAEKLFNALDVTPVTRNLFNKRTVSTKVLPGILCQQIEILGAPTYPTPATDAATLPVIVEKTEFTCQIAKKLPSFLAKGIYEVITAEEEIFEHPGENAPKVTVKKVCHMKFVKLEKSNGIVLYKVKKIKMLKVTGVGAEKIYEALNITPEIEDHNGNDSLVKKAGALTCKKIITEDNTVEFMCKMKKQGHH